MIDEVEQVYQNTFWASFDAYEVCMAALALAKRGMNIESMFLLWGSGGVGLSLLTTHLEAVYTHEPHRYFDPNIFYNDEEIRKVIETLAGGDYLYRTGKACGYSQGHQRGSVEEVHKR
jgi:hypothetical protein